MFSNLRYALRSLAKSPGFSVVAVLTVALGIGANTAFFSVFNAQALAPFPYPEADRVAQLWSASGAAFDPRLWSAPDFRDVREQATSWADMGAYQALRFNLGGEHPETVEGITGTAGVWRTLALPPALGRWLNDNDDLPNAAPVVVLSHGCWIRSFGADPSLVGRAVRLNGRNCTVVGIAPANFEFYSPATGATAIDLWVPLNLQDDHFGRATRFLHAIGRLAAGRSIAQANAELRSIAQRLAAAHPATNATQRFFARSLARELAGRSASALALVFGAVVVVLLVACANLAIMFLARGASRQTEYAVRLALGGTRRRLVGLALTESLLVCLAGGGLGVLLADLGSGLLTALFPPATTHAAAVQVDPAVLAWSIVLALGATLGAGLPPAWIAAQAQVVDAMKQGGSTQAGGRARHRFLQLLVSAQIGIAFVLVNTALLLLAGYRHAVAINQPLASGYVLASQLTLRGPAYADIGERAAFWERLVARVQAQPGVTAAAVTTQLPLRGGNQTTILAGTQGFDPTVVRPGIEQSFVSPEYFVAMGLRILQGRALAAADAGFDSTGVVINRAFADLYWPGQNAVGQPIRNNDAPLYWSARVVGVVENVRQADLGRPALPEMFFAYGWNPRNTAHLVVRSAFDARLMLPMLRRELATLDPDLALSRVTTMAEVVDGAARGRRTLLRLIQFFMVGTLLMAAIGVYGTLAFQTRQRTREVGVRLALGASARDVRALVLREAVVWLGGGAVLGLGLSCALVPVLRTVCADVNFVNPLYYLGGLIALGGVLLLACWLPARRATRVDPVEALRAE
jgi:predicted permease